MTRRSVTDRAVQPIVRRLVEEFLRLGSVNAVHRAMTDVLSPDGAAIYPNRIHALLSDDPSRSVNAQTLQAASRALERLSSRPDSPNTRGAEFRTQILAAWANLATERRLSNLTDERESIHWIAEELSIPAAVVRSVLEAVDTTDQSLRLPGASVSGLPPGAKQLPDWSYQDDAYMACLRSLQGEPNRKTGLIVPTGGGKTRIAIRVLLRMLADDPRSNSVSLWVTHRRFLGAQARRELLKAISEGTKDIPEDAVKLLADRVVFAMVTDLERTLAEYGDRVALAVVDEAHHAAAPSYTPLFAHKPMRGLFLTATPNRTDGLGIGVDDIAYTITYRELFARGVLIDPTFEDPIVLAPGAWESPEDLVDLADYILDRSESEFVKSLIVTSRVDHAVRLHEVIVKALEARRHASTHVLEVEDVGFVHGGGSSTGAAPADFLDEFKAKPRGVLIATAAMLGEGFDDPSVNAVVVTYPTGSIIQLMQAAGRCLRYAPGKRRAFVVQVKESNLAYHFEHRWLYQDISDVLRPQLIDRYYTNSADLETQVRSLLATRRVSSLVQDTVIRKLSLVERGQSFSILLTGLQFEGDASKFIDEAEWNAVPVPHSSRELFLRVFNTYSIRVGEMKFATDFLRNYLDVDPSEGSEWTIYRDMLFAMEYANREIKGETYFSSLPRSYQSHRGTTWLTYVTFKFEPSANEGLEAFLADALNREYVLAQYSADPDPFSACVKILHPLGGTIGFLLNAIQLAWLRSESDRLIAEIRAVEPLDAFGRIEAWRAGLPECPVPQQIVMRIDVFLDKARFDSLVYVLPRPSPQADNLQLT